MFRLTAMALLLSSCLQASDEPAPPPTVTSAPARAGEVTAYIWTHFQGDADLAPHVSWTSDPCISSNADHLRGKCLAGLYSKRAHSAWVRKDGTISGSSLAHELMHAALYVNTGDSDTDHAGSKWERVETINQVLYEAGL